MLENLWLIVSALLVFMMQVGFLCLESGRTRSKNSINVAAKNISDFILSASIFWILGFGLMFGSSFAGFFGTDSFAFGENNSAYELCFFLFQMMFCGTAATLTSGATAERMTFTGYIFVTMILSTFIYPLTGHWAWAGLFNPENPGWLESLGFVDFAGATVVHSVGGWIALSAVLIIGPRLGRYDENRSFPSGSNLPMATMGALLIWFGWFGFNGGSVLELNEQVPGILLNTFLGAIWGGFIASSLHYFDKRFIDVGFILNGIIAGLVGITAACHAVSPFSAAVIGMVAGIILYYGDRWIQSLKIDDALGVIPAHLLAGIWGTLAFALFAKPEFLSNDLSRIEQLTIQLLGVCVIGFYSFFVSYFLLRLVNQFYPLRVSAEDELQGLNITEHRASTELIDLLGDMEKQQSQGNYTSPVKEEPFTEVGQIARKYNQVITRINQEMVERDMAINQFQASERRKSAILDSSMDCIISIDWQGRIIEFNPSAERTLGCLKKQVKGKKFIDYFVLKGDRDQVRHSLKHFFSAANGLVLNHRNSISLQRISGNQFPAEVTITSTRMDDESRTEFTLHIRDVTKDQKLQSRLKFLAYQDPLTSLSNRTHLMKQLNSAIHLAQSTKETVALLFMDLDKFKKINDTLGHKAGDELLCEVAHRLTKVSRQEDIIARWGGDEFIVVLSGELSDEIISNKAQNILEVMRNPVEIAGKQFSIPTSIGVALSVHGSIEADHLIQEADIAMYSAKMNGRDNFKLFEPYMAEHATKSVTFERMIKKALQLDQFHLVFQPKVLRTHDEIIALEALIRWQHPEKGMIPPSEFIPIAEESNLIVQLGEKVISHSLRQLSEWKKQGIDLVPVSVNISGKHLISDELLPFIKQQLSLHSIPGHLLEIEITEGVLIQDIERCIEVLEQLKRLKINISIDDFGTGYSSLNYLKRLPLDILKIDQSFVDECASKEEDGEICATIISLAQSLNLDTVAEGVETEAQLETLLKMGCEVFQGYYFYRPLQAREISDLLLKSDEIEINPLDSVNA
ncbi:ammonium transporter [Neptuniibacter sp.]|uniref:ammonium transporter n=1 Tax=Neptuniibacter sp. TaxID=1962643 RepID=UPI002607D0A3|nr:ammonium transporter [Neptuniibacter sp.]MCP4596589.1 ammonium transporter [Neptuniibacter sp.]